MKKLFKLTLIAILLIAFFKPETVSANMAMPEFSDIGSSVSFEKNDDLAVLSEVLDIKVYGSRAGIVARYRMKNTTDRALSTPSMFLSPNIEDSDVEILVNGKVQDFTVKRYYFNYTDDVKVKGWEYQALEEDDKNHSDQVLDAINFQMDFAANEEYEVLVSYGYSLGGYPEYDYDVKYGKIIYFLQPAALWKDFSNLTINLSLDKDMPVIKESNLEFEKVGKGSYQYVSDTLPEGNLEISITENSWQKFWSALRSPYLLMYPFPLILYIIVFSLPVFILIKTLLYIKKKHKSKKEDQ